MATKLPEFTYTGSYKTEMKNGCWYIFFLTGGTLTMTYAKTAEVYLHGGGGGGGASGWNASGGSGGGGGWFATHTGVPVEAGKAYSIVVGGGGRSSIYEDGGNGLGSGFNGGPSSAFGYSVDGGKGGYKMGDGGAGGSGNGGMRGSSTGDYGGPGGSNTTYAFNDPDCGLIYGGGGGGGAPRYGGYGAGGKPYGGQDNQPAAANTGAGGAGANYEDSELGRSGSYGGSGIVILRSTQDDQIPVVYDGTRLTQMHFNGTQLTGLVYNGVRLFIKRLAERLASGIRGWRKEGKKRHGGIVYGTGGA